jgi:hypothetical protein
MTLIEQIQAQPRKRAANDSGMLGVSKDVLNELRQVSARYSVPMGRVAEIAIARLITEINLTVK